MVSCDHDVAGGGLRRGHAGHVSRSHAACKRPRRPSDGRHPGPGNIRRACSAAPAAPAASIPFCESGGGSIVPTREFLRWRASVKAGLLPAVAPERLKSLGILIHIQLTAIVLILLMAAMMAKGIGLLT